MKCDETAFAEPLFSILANRRRRCIVRLLYDTEPLSLRDAARIIYASEHAVPREDVSGDQQNTIYVTLYQDHAPKMDTADIIEYNQQAKTVSRGTHWQLTHDILFWVDYKLST
jgi:hypothetical protein